MFEMFKNAVIRTRAGSMMNWRSPGSVSAPADPASFHVVTPDEDATGSGSIPQYVTLWKMCVCRSTSPGVTYCPLASMTWDAASAGMSASTAAIRSPVTATSSMPSWPPPGSTTSPPRITRSNCIASPFLPRSVAVRSRLESRADPVERIEAVQPVVVEIDARDAAVTGESNLLREVLRRFAVRRRRSQRQRDRALAERLPIGLQIESQALDVGRVAGHLDLRTGARQLREVDAEAPRDVGGGRAARPPGGIPLHGAGEFEEDEALAARVGDLSRLPRQRRD